MRPTAGACWERASSMNTADGRDTRRRSTHECDAAGRPERTLEQHGINRFGGGRAREQHVAVVRGESALREGPLSRCRCRRL